MLNFPKTCAQCHRAWSFNHECTRPVDEWSVDPLCEHRARHDYSCDYCRQTWAGATAPASLICPDCGGMLTEEEPY